MKRLFFIVFIMIFIAGGGIAGLMVLEIIPNPFAAPEEEMAEEDSNGEGSGNEGGSSGFTPPERQPILFTLEDLIIPVILDARVVKRVYITARMEIVPGNRSAVDNGLSRMESALNENLIVYFQNHFANNRRLDLRGIKRVMMRSAEQVYGDMVSDVLLLTVFEQENHHRSPANSLKISEPNRKLS